MRVCVYIKCGAKLRKKSHMCLIISSFCFCIVSFFRLFSRCYKNISHFLRFIVAKTKKCVNFVAKFQYQYN